MKHDTRMKRPGIVGRMANTKTVHIVERNASRWGEAHEDGVHVLAGSRDDVQNAVYDAVTHGLTTVYAYYNYASGVAQKGG